ncbi:MAG: class I SAM-dependent methyltransferase [Desulfonatronovibrio sp.]
MVNNLYNLIFSDMTRLCYNNCLQLYPQNAEILDVGIGNGVMIKKNHKLIKEKNLRITGLDINKHYLEHCRKMIIEFGLEQQVKAIRQSVLTFNPPKTHCYDYIFFGQSFMLMNDQKKILERTKDWLRPEGKVIFFQTMFKNKSKLMEFVKPRLKFLTTVDFGKVTYEKDFYALLDHGNFSSCEDKLLKKNVFKGEHRLIVTQPEQMVHN